MNSTRYQKSRRIEIYSGRRSTGAMAGLKNQLDSGSIAGSGNSRQLEWTMVRARYEGATPLLIALYDDKVISGVVILFERTFLGIPIGMFTSPYQCGYGSYVGRRDRRSRNMRDAVDAAYSIGRSISVEARLSIDQGDRVDTRFEPHTAHVTVDDIEKGSYFPLCDSFGETMSRFSHKTRRNIRYYNKKADVDHGCIYLEEMTDADSLDAVTILNSGSLRQLSHFRAAYRTTSTRSTPGGFSVGLRDRDGAWLSYLTGWRADGICYVDWQINNEDSNRISFSMVMRSRLIEHEIARGTKALYFLGGSNRTWEAACIGHSVRAIRRERSGSVIKSLNPLISYLSSFRPINRFRRFVNIMILRQ